MATNLVDRVREVVAAESDDFYSDDTIEYYLNQSQNRVLSFAFGKEAELSKVSGTRKTLRCLDSLRTRYEEDVSDLEYTKFKDYYRTDLTPPSEVANIIHLRYRDNTIMRELNPYQLSDLSWGNLEVSENEGYFIVVTKNDNTVVELYVYEDGSEENPKEGYVHLYYYKLPESISSSDNKLNSIPETLTNAVIYGAAVMMIMQESTENPQSQIEAFRMMYQEELMSNIY